MASGELTGATQDEVEELREDYKGTPASEKWDFEEARCLTRIGKQPEDYDGPDRYCKRWTVKVEEDDGSMRRGASCPFHGGDHGGKRADLLEPDTYGITLSHGFFASRKNLIEDFDTPEKDFYETVMTEWPEKYGIDFEADPSAMEDMHALAVEIIRDHRANDEIQSDGLTVTEPVYDSEGNYVDDQEKPHYLIAEEQKQRKLVMKMKKELGISRKHRDVMDAEQDKADALEGSLASLLSADE